MLQPGGSKCDYDGTIFDNPIYLPYDDPETNAAKALADLEIALPSHGDLRKRTPLFTLDQNGTSLDHNMADEIFKQLALLALGLVIARTVSIHSGRVW